MESYTKQLWEGKLCASRLYRASLNEAEQCAKLDYYVNRLAKTLTPEQRTSLEQLVRYYEERENDAVFHAFSVGYQTGMSLAAEARSKKE